MFGYSAYDLGISMEDYMDTIREEDLRVDAAFDAYMDSIREETVDSNPPKGYCGSDAIFSSLPPEVFIDAIRMEDLPF